MGEMRNVWEGDYTNLRIVVREKIERGFPRKYYKVWLYGNMESELPGEMDNVTLLHDGITVFDFTGNIFAGGNKKLNLKIYRQDNGVVRAEIQV